MSQVRIGIRLEDKSEWERRAPLTPDDIRELRTRHGLEFTVEPSSARIYPDSEYEKAGAEVRMGLEECDLIVGIKEVPVPRLVPGKPHLFFSHTIKGQSYNMSLLQEILDKKVTLIDYEKVTDERGMRLIAFSTQAGQAGMINTLWSLGQRWREMGIETPFANLKQAMTYPAGLDHPRKAIREAGEQVREHGLPASISPVVIAITGIGRVSSGAQDILEELEPIELKPKDLLNPETMSHLSHHEVYKVVLDMQHFLLHSDGSTSFDFDEYLEFPERYHSRFMEYVPCLSAIVNGIYWEPRFPRLMTRDDVAALYTDGKSPKLTVIGDVTCDPEGSIECTLEPALPDKPVYVYNPETGSISYGFDGQGLLMMAVDILPTEIPMTSSIRFGSKLKPFLPAIARADYSEAFVNLDLPDEFKRAVIAHRGELTPDYLYLKKFL